MTGRCGGPKFVPRPFPGIYDPPGPNPEVVEELREQIRERDAEARADDGVIRPDFSGFRRSRSPTPSTPSSPASPRPAPEPEPLVEPWMKEWAAKVAEGMGIKS